MSVEGRRRVDNALPAQARRALLHVGQQGEGHPFAAISELIKSGRIANRLNLKGPNYLLDAACSSSLLSVVLARWFNSALAGRGEQKPELPATSSRS